MLANVDLTKFAFPNVSGLRDTQPSPRGVQCAVLCRAALHWLKCRVRCCALLFCVCAVSCCVVLCCGVPALGLCRALQFCAVRYNDSRDTPPHPLGTLHPTLFTYPQFPFPVPLSVFPRPCTYMFAVVVRLPSHPHITGAVGMNDFDQQSLLVAYPLADGDLLEPVTRRTSMVESTIMR